MCERERGRAGGAGWQGRKMQERRIQEEDAGEEDGEGEEDDEGEEDAAR